MSIILDIEFGRLQARDLLQHLWTGPISNASVDVVQGGRSVEVRAVGLTKVHHFNYMQVLDSICFGFISVTSCLLFPCAVLCICREQLLTVS